MTRSALRDSFNISDPVIIFNPNEADSGGDTIITGHTSGQTQGVHYDISLDTSRTFYGDASLKLSNTRVGSTSQSSVEWVLPAAITASDLAKYNRLIIPIYVENAELNGLFIRMADADSAVNYKTFSCRASAVGTDIEHNVWMYLVYEWNLAASTSNPRAPEPYEDVGTVSNVDRLKIIINKENANTDSHVWIGGIFVGGRQRPKLLFTFDDSNDTDYSEAFLGTSLVNSFQDYGWKGCSAIVGNLIGSGGALSEAQIATMADYGWEFINHGWTHVDHSALSEVDAKSSFTDMKNWLDARGYINDAFCYPQGGWSTDTRQWLRDVGITWSTGGGGAAVEHKYKIPVFSGGGYEPMDDARNITFTSAALSTNIAQINNCIKYGSTMYCSFHKIVASGATTNEINAADMDTIMAFIRLKERQGLLDVTTLSEYRSSL